MRVCILATGLLLSLVCCKTKSYYGAISENEQKFSGSKKEMALHLVEVGNEAQFVKNLAVLARQNALLRTTYVAASDIETLMNDLIFDLNVFATKTRVKLPGALDADADRDYQFVEQKIGTEKFDEYYLNESLRYLSDLRQRLKTYSTSGDEENARAFSSRQLSEINRSFSLLDSARSEMTTPSSSK